jgi:hypothetical protein
MAGAGLVIYRKLIAKGIGHKVSATPGRRILGWGMKIFFRDLGGGMK